TSTNDTCLLLANGAANTPMITAATPEAESFACLLDDLLLDLAKQIVKDGEGATKFVEIRITGACTDADAKQAALSVANSSLVKTAFFG
ncbi:bifunctional ornithine acetyltransferase/N-acetylglutamate synthase, partial [bacterium]|nr:bifunctional ornithine acetyltransferase/N-acetylglutamate synthase [bacterium]